MQQYKKAYMGVGLLVVALLLSLLFLAFRGSETSSLSESGKFSLYAKFDNVSGLHRHAPIRVAGVKVGYVDAIQLDPKTYQARVDMVFTQELGVPNDSAASIYTDGLLGAKYISIQVGFDEVMLKDGARIERTSSGLVLEEFLASAVNMMRKSDD